MVDWEIALAGLRLADRHAVASQKAVKRPRASA
jgi:hypothetical protein